MNSKTILTALGILLLGGIGGYYFAPTKTITKTETVTVVKEVEKKQDDSNTKKQKNKTYVRVETILPDGTKRIETKIVDNGTITIDASSSSETKTGSSTDTSTEKTVERASPVVIYAIGSANLSNLAEGPDYGIGVQKQLIGPIWFGGQFQKSGTLGITLGIAL